jgi:tungstate transport system substrate-binding protein
VAVDVLPPAFYTILTVVNVNTRYLDISALNLRPAAVAVARVYSTFLQSEGKMFMLRLLVLILSLVATRAAMADERFITLSSTTSTQDSGLFGYILPIFHAATGIDVHVVAVGTGQALAIGMRGDADALLVHDRIREDKFVAEGYGIDRRDVMYNDFVIVGPSADPAHIRGLKDAQTALARIAAAKSPFTSRGDDSGTNRMELRLWKSAGIQPDPHSGWYRDLGQGMGPTLNIAAGMNAYTLTDRATWANFKNRQGLEILTEGDPALFNPYGSILVNPAKWPHVKFSDAKMWHEWLTTKPGLDAITSYKINGEELFFRRVAKPRTNLLSGRARDTG